MIEESTEIDKGNQISISNKTIKIGRSSQCDIRYSDKYSNVSREHLILNYLGKSIELLPLHGSNNKTYIDDKEISKSEFLRSNATIRLAYGGPRFKIILTTKESIGLKSILDLEKIDVAILFSILLFLFLSIKIFIQLAL